MPVFILIEALCLQDENGVQLTLAEFSDFVDLSASLLTDSNFKAGMRSVVMQPPGLCLTDQLTSPQVAQQTLQALAMLVSKEPDAIRPYANSIIPLVVRFRQENAYHRAHAAAPFTIVTISVHRLMQVERLADARQPVRQDACEVLLRLLEQLGADAVIPRLSRFWSHRSWKVKGSEFQRAVSDLIRIYFCTGTSQCSLLLIAY